MTDHKPASGLVPALSPQEARKQVFREAAAMIRARNPKTNMGSTNSVLDDLERDLLQAGAGSSTAEHLTGAGMEVAGSTPAPASLAVPQPMHDLYAICCSERQRLADTLAEVVHEREVLKRSTAGYAEGIAAAARVAKTAHQRRPCLVSETDDHYLGRCEEMEAIARDIRALQPPGRPEEESGRDAAVIAARKEFPGQERKDDA